MKPLTWGDTPKRRVRSLLDALLSYEEWQRNGVDIPGHTSKWRNKGSKSHKLVVDTKVRHLLELLKKQGCQDIFNLKDPSESVRAILNRLEDLEILKDDRRQDQGSEDWQFTLTLWSKDKTINLNKFDIEWENHRPGKSKAQEYIQTAIPQQTNAPLKKLQPRLEETVDLYLAQCFRNDKFAKLDQAGDRDEGDTKLVRVFIDLNVRIRQGSQPHDMRLKKLSAPGKRELTIEQLALFEGTDSFSAMNCLLREDYLKVVIIGGPGQGKSTLGQQLAQVHRAKLLNETYDDKYQPDTSRIPFHVVLREFAQWLANETDLDALEAYLAYWVGKLAKRSGEVTAQDIQEIIRSRPCLLILDGLDEVVAPKLQRRMINRIEDFLGAAEQLGANLMVVASSRPNGYDDQFDPERFLNLELELLSPDKVTEYAEKWVEAKELGQEDRCKILPTLKDCQKDSSIAELLVTPLQVSIILIIIKSGRRPPSERENLFNEYWLTIFRREEGKNNKINEIIQNQESHLLNIHAYLGYILHRKAAAQNVQSLLPEADFKQSICEFLRKKNKRLKEEEISSKMEQLVKEVGDRLYMIVQREKGQFGFDLRSFQEFFAAVHLVQTASSTEERFNRLKAIARSEHWTNVALFMAGRIARTLTGEATRLEPAWRAVDRDGVNRYLKPGAWFALQIAADGALGDETDLQYSAVEDGLKVLETGLTEKQQDLLKSLAKRLPQKDQQEILRPVLEDKLRALPEGCLIPALALYSQCFGTTPLFLEKTDALLQSQRENLVNSALELALERKPDPTWMVQRLQNHWSYWKKRLLTLWFRSVEDQKYVEKLLSVWSLSEEQVKELAEATLESLPYYPGHFHKKSQSTIPEEPKSLLEQLIVMLRCSDLLAFYTRNVHRSEIRVGKWGEISIAALGKPVSPRSISNGLAKFIGNQLQRSDLMVPLRVQLWRLFWFIGKPDSVNVSAFLEDIWTIQQRQELSNRFWRYWGLTSTWPLLDLAAERQQIEGLDAVKYLLPFLDENNQLSVAQQVTETIKTYIKQADETQKQRLLIAIQTQSGLNELLPQLVPLANEMSIAVEELVDAHIGSYPYTSYNLFEYQIKLVQNLLTAAQRVIDNRYKLVRLLWGLINEVTWISAPEILNQARQLLELILEHWSTLAEPPLTEFILILFLNLLIHDEQIQPTAHRLFTTLSKTELLQLESWRIYEVINEPVSEYLSVLKSFLEHDDEDVRVGVALLLKAIIEAPVRYRRGNDKELIQELKNIRFDLEMGINFLEYEDSKHRLVGIALLTYSNYPVEDIKYRNQLLVALQHAKIAVEERAWAELLQKIPISEEHQSRWSSLLEEILAEPRNYGSLVLSAAMGRYQRLNSAANVTISEEQEKELGLP